MKFGLLYSLTDLLVAMLLPLRLRVWHSRGTFPMRSQRRKFHDITTMTFTIALASRISAPADLESSPHVYGAFGRCDDWMRMAAVVMMSRAGADDCPSSALAKCDEV